MGGGAEAFERLTELFYRKVHQDSLLAPVFAHVGPDHAHHVALWLAEVFAAGAEPTPEAPVPRWGWGEAPPATDQSAG